MCAGVAVSGGARGLSGADIRESNIGAILRTLRAEGPLSRSGLAQRLALSKSGMTPIIAEMVERGLVREQAGTLQRRGRPPLLLSVKADDLCIVGVELRRDRVGYTVEAFDGSTLMSVHRAHESIPEDPGHAAALVAYLVLEAQQSTARTAVAVGICLPGSTRGDGRVDAPVLEWRDVPLMHLIEEALTPWHPLVLIADIAAAATLGNPEATEEHRVRAHIQFGPGLGLGVCEIHPGTSPRPESRRLGHIAWPGATARCWCGSHGCLDTVLGLREITRELHQHGGLEPEQYSAELSSAITAVQHASPKKLTAWQDNIATRIAWVVRLVAQLEQPDLITLGGYVTRLDVSFETALGKRLIPENGIPESVDVLLSSNDDAAMRGVATAAGDLVFVAPLAALESAQNAARIS